MSIPFYRPLETCIGFHLLAVCLSLSHVIKLMMSSRFGRALNSLGHRSVMIKNASFWTGSHLMFCLFLLVLLTSRRLLLFLCVRAVKLGVKRNYHNYNYLKMFLFS